LLKTLGKTARGHFEKTCTEAPQILLAESQNIKLNLKLNLVIVKHSLTQYTAVWLGPPNPSRPNHTAL